jgi:hypothetical protein
MELPRRQFLHLAAAAAALPAVSPLASAQSYPTRPVHLIEGFGAGGAPDIVARLIGQSLSEQLGQSFVVENRSGASSNIAAEAVARASPDGYTLLLITTANAVNASMFKLNFDFIRDIAPVASIVRVPLVMEVHPSVSARTVAEFIAYAKANPGKINLASAGTGSLTHVAGEMFKTMAGVDRALSRRTGVSRSSRWRCACIFWSTALIDRICQSQQTPRLGRNHHEAVGRAAGRSGSERHLAGLRGKCLVRHRRSEEHACRAHRKTEQGSQREHCRSKIQSAACQCGRHGACRLARRFRQTHLGRDQEVGQGDSGGQHQAGMNGRRPAALRDFDPLVSAWGQFRQIDTLPRLAACPLWRKRKR